MGDSEKTITLEFFAQFREDTGKNRDQIKTRSTTARELYEELDRRHGFRSRPETTRIAVNDSLASWSTLIQDGDTVVFLTPFGGG